MRRPKKSRSSRASRPSAGGGGPSSTGPALSQRSATRKLAAVHRPDSGANTGDPTAFSGVIEITILLSAISQRLFGFGRE